MTSLRIIVLSAALVLAFGISALAQNVTVNPGAGSYPDMASAFAAINAGTHTGSVTVLIVGDTSEPAGGAILNASGTGAASYTSVFISPSGGAARTVSGAVTAGFPMIDINGADNVTINGLNTGGNSLTISNTTAAATAETSTIRFIGGATNNTVTNSTILGSFNGTAATLGGTVYFSTDTVALTGNDNNIISNNNIGPAGANLPTKGVFGSGTGTTIANYNSDIQITGNNIYDYFGAVVTSAGIYLGAANTDWTISNNKLFQTGSRTQTTGAVHAGIQIASVNVNNCTISGNTIGYGSSSGTGIYDIAGLAGTRFYPIYFSAHGLVTATSIQGNTISGISVSGVLNGSGLTSPFTGIIIISGLAHIGDVTGNTIGSGTVPGSISCASSGIVLTEVAGIYYFPSKAVTVSNNTIAGITANNTSTGAVNLYPLHVDTDNSVINTIMNNTVGTAAAPIENKANGSAGSRVVGIYSQAGASFIVGNTISNLTVDAPNVGTSNFQSMIGIWSNSFSTLGDNVSQNTIRFLSNTNATAAVSVAGIQIIASSAGNNIFQRNLIHSLSTPSSGAAVVNGIVAASGVAQIVNNMIALGTDMTAQSPQINGISENLAGVNFFYHNSVYIGGSGVAAGTGNSWALRSSVTSTRSYRDNIFYNARSNGGATGKHYAIQVGGTAPSPAGLTSNNNVLYVTGSGGILGLFNGIDQPTLAAWKTATGNDANSFSGDPAFNNPTNVTPDLHIHPTNPSVAEGNGADVGVLDDFDGQTRSTLTPTDIGADAGNFSGPDVAAPSISYPALGNSSLTTARVIPVVLTDLTGVATGGLAPRVYYKKNAGAYASTACSISSGTVTNGTWNCTVDYSLIGGVVLNDVIRVFVVAQDTVGNLSANPSAGFTGSNVNTVTTPPTIPNFYLIVPVIGGSINVGPGEAYTSLTNIGGVFDTINKSALSGNLTINITQDLTSELGSVSINEWSEDGPGNYYVLIKPSGGPRVITGSNAGALIRTIGADRLRIDGSTAATGGAGDAVADVGGNPALRELTIQNTDNGTSAMVIALQAGPNGTQNNTIQNVNILGEDASTSFIGIAIGGSPGTPGKDNDGNRVQNCSIKRELYGIYSAGEGAANPNTGTVFTQNDLGGTGADRIRRIGIFVFSEDGIQISENSVSTQPDIGQTTDTIGIGVGAQSVSADILDSGNITNASVVRNKINGVEARGAGAASAVGIAIAGGFGGANTIANNMVTGVTSPSINHDLVAGICVVGVANSDTRLYFNSVSMTGDRGGPLTLQQPSYGVAISGLSPVVTMKDNIFYNTQTSSIGGADAKSYAIGMEAASFVNLDSDFNDFFSSGAYAGGFRTGSLNAGSGTDYANLAAWQAASADDTHSKEVDPLFNDPTKDLHIGATSTLINMGSLVGGVTDDFDGQVRPHDATTDIGADEFYFATPTSTSTNTPTASPTNTVTNTPTNTPTPSQTNTPTATSTSTPSGSPTPTPGICSVSNGGLNPQAVSEGGTSAPAGFFWSELQHNTGNFLEANNSAGSAASQGANRLADDFTITSLCTIDTITLYGYQTGGPATTPFTASTLQIWNGRPGDPGSSVIFGDTTTNRLASSVDSNYYRIFNTFVPPPGVVPGTTRKIWRNTLTVGTTLPAGTYWIDWDSTITTAGNHFYPTQTIAGSRGSAGANGRQLTVSTGAWADVIDIGNPASAPDVIQDFPFDVSGTAAAPTPTNTPTATATNTPTATATSTPGGSASISGTVTYGNAAVPPKFISNVTVTGTGSPNVFTTTAAPGATGGQYTLTGFGSGSYTVSLSKTTGQNGITSNDAARIAQHVAGVSVLTTDIQKVTADVSNNGTLSSNDAALIARFVAGVGAPIGNTNQWRFFIPPGPTFPVGASPTTRTYNPVTGTLTGEDYIGLLIGDVTGNWAPSAARPAQGPERKTSIAAPSLVASADNEVLIPVAVEGAANKGIISYEFDLKYDPAVIQPQADPINLKDTASKGLTAVANPNEPGLLRVVVYGAYPIDTNGVLMNLKFTAVGAPGTISPLTWERVMFNEGDPGTLTANGQVELSAAAANQAEMTGRVVNTIGQGIVNARVTLTDTTGQTRSVMSNGFGTYRFGGLNVGQTFTVTVDAKQMAFTPLTVSVTGLSVNVDMIAEQ